MFKKIALVLLGCNFLTLQLAAARDCSQLSWSELDWLEKSCVVLICTTAVGTTAAIIVYAPVIIAAIKTGIAVATPVVKTAGPIVFVADRAVQVANKAPEIELHMVTSVESSKFLRAKEDFEKCMNKHAGSNRAIVPEVCKKEKLLFALLEQVNASA